MRRVERKLASLMYQRRLIQDLATKLAVKQALEKSLEAALLAELRQGRAVRWNGYTAKLTIRRERAKASLHFLVARLGEPTARGVWEALPVRRQEVVTVEAPPAAAAEPREAA
jgi:hypothetical protein